MPLTPNVIPDGPIESDWGNEIRDRSIQMFNNVADRDGAWPSPPEGATCITLDTFTYWTYRSSEWENLLGLPTGSLQAFAGAEGVIPVGWLLCDGHAVSRTTYARLFTVIGTTYGTGDNSTTFNLPDLRGRVAFGKDNMGGTSANRVAAAYADTLGGNGGEDDHVLSLAEMPTHRHTYDAAGGTNNVMIKDAGSSYWATTDGGVGQRITGNSLAGATGYEGDGATHNNMQPSIAVNYIIKW